MLKLALIIFLAMTFGYIFGRLQQYNIDDLVPILFILENESGENDEKTFRVVPGDWVSNDNPDELFSENGAGMLIPSDGDYSMFFNVETDELEGKDLFVNSGKKRHLKNYSYLRRKYITSSKIKKI